MVKMIIYFADMKTYHKFGLAMKKMNNISAIIKVVIIDHRL